MKKGVVGNVNQLVGCLTACLLDRPPDRPPTLPAPSPPLSPPLCLCPCGGWLAAFGPSEAVAPAKMAAD